MIFIKKISIDLKLIYGILIFFFIFAFTNSYFFSPSVTVKLIGLLIFIIGIIPILNHYSKKKKLFHYFICIYYFML